LRPQIKLSKSASRMKKPKTQLQLSSKLSLRKSALRPPRFNKSRKIKPPRRQKWLPKLRFPKRRMRNLTLKSLKRSLWRKSSKRQPSLKWWNQRL